MSETDNELRELLSAFIDSGLEGHEVTREQWERACLLCGRYCPPYVHLATTPTPETPVSMAVNIRASGDTRQIDFVQLACTRAAHTAKHAFAGGPVTATLTIEWPDGTVDAAQSFLPKTCETCSGLGLVYARPFDKPCPACAAPPRSE